MGCQKVRMGFLEIYEASTIENKKVSLLYICVNLHDCSSRFMVDISCSLTIVAYHSLLWIV